MASVSSAQDALRRCRRILQNVRCDTRGATDIERPNAVELELGRIVGVGHDKSEISRPLGAVVAGLGGHDAAAVATPTATVQCVATDDVIMIIGHTPHTAIMIRQVQVQMQAQARTSCNGQTPPCAAASGSAWADSLVAVSQGVILPHDLHIDKATTVEDNIQVVLVWLHDARRVSLAPAHALGVGGVRAQATASCEHHV